MMTSLNRLLTKDKLFYFLSLISIVSIIQYTFFIVPTARQTYNEESSSGSQINYLQQYLRRVTFHSHTYSCARLFKQDENEIGKVWDYLNRTSFSEFPAVSFIKITEDCSAFKTSLGYRNSGSTEEEEFPLAYSILTHGHIEEVERLLRMVYTPQNVYCIHVDLKSAPHFHLAVQSLVKCFNNVFIASKLESVTYEHFSRLKADLNCITDLLHKNKPWKYLINLASSEIPLKTNLEMIQILKQLKGRNDIREVFNRRSLVRFTFRYYEYDGVLVKTPRLSPPPPHNLTVTKGLAYGAFSRRFLKFHSTNEIARDFLIWSMDTHSPDEHYWATLNNLYHNSFLETPGGFTGHPDSAPYISRHVVWKGTKRPCHGNYRHNICVFGPGDLPSLKVTNKLIANKFEVLHNPVTYACMEELLRNRTMKT